MWENSTPYSGEHGSRGFHHSSGFPDRHELSDPTSDEDQAGPTVIGKEPELSYILTPAKISIGEAEKGAEGIWSSTGPPQWAGRHTHTY